MSRPLVRLLAVLLAVSAFAPAAAAPLEEDDRTFRVALGLADLDRGEFFSSDLESADGPALDVSVGWMRSRVFEVGLHASYLGLDVDDGAPDAGQSLNGILYGGFLAAHIPTEGNLSPYGIVDLLLFAGDFSNAYEYGYGIGAGLSIVPGERWGADVRIEYQNFNGEFDAGDAGVPGRDFAPDANQLRLSAGFVLRY